MNRHLYWLRFRRVGQDGMDAIDISTQFVSRLLREELRSTPAGGPCTGLGMVALTARLRSVAHSLSDFALFASVEDLRIFTLEDDLVATVGDNGIELCLPATQETV